MTISYVQTLSLYQTGSGSIIGATSIVLTGLQDIYGNVLTMASFGAIGYGTCESDTTNEEAFIFTGITANTNGTYTLTGISTILAQTPYTATSGLIRQHSGGTKVVITDNVAFWATFGNIANLNEWAQTQTFDVPPISATDPTTSNEVANKHYVDNVAVAGAPNASTTVKGIVQEATQAQMDAGTTSGSTGADLYPTPALIRSKQRSDYVVDTGTADVYAIAPSPAITAYATGQEFTFKVTHTNTTTTPTLNVSTIGAKTLVKLNGSTAMAAGDLAVGQVVTVMYDGTNMQVLTPTANSVNLDSNGKVPVADTYFNYQDFVASGTWTKPTGLTGNEMILVQAWGGGGGGGGSKAGSVASQGGGGGGGGCYVEQRFRVSDLTSTVTVTIGAAGSAGSGTTPTGGGIGGDTSFGSFVIAYGGGGGGYANSGGGSGGGGGGGGGGGLLADGSSGSNNQSSGAGGGAGGGPSGGAAGTQAIAFGGSGGGNAGNNTGATAIYGGAGGGGGNVGATIGAAGGAAFYGGGGGGGGGDVSKNGAGGAGKAGYGGAGGNGGAAVAGSNGVAPGGGGGGGGSATSGSNVNGGTGALGEVRVFVLI